MKLPTSSIPVAFLALAVLASQGRAQVGTPFAPPRLVNSTGATDSTSDDSVRLVFNGFRKLWAVYRAIDPLDGDPDIHLSTSRDGGVSWTPTTVANPTFDTDTADDGDPALATSGTSVTLVYASDRLQSPGEHDISWGSAGTTTDQFSYNGHVNDDFSNDVGDDRLPCIATGGGASVCIWQRTVAGEADLCFARKVASSTLWSSVAFLNSNATTDSGQDRNPRVATDDAGNWVAVWDSTTDLVGDGGVDTNIFFSRSTDNGVTWSAPQLLNSTAPTDGTALDSFPVVAADATTGEFVVAWISESTLGGTIGSDRDIVWSISTNHGATWSAAAALNDDAATDQLVAFSNDVFPELVNDGRGHFVCAWQRGDLPFTESDLFAARFDLSTGVWSAHTLLNTNGAADVGSDFRPALATSDEGHWIAGWTSTENLGGAIGTDSDVLAAHFAIPAAQNPGTRFCAGFREDGLLRCPCGNDVAPTNLGRGCANSTGQGGSINASGSASLSASSAGVGGSDMPPNSTALYFQGTAQVNFGEGSAFGDGLRCVGGTVVRIGVSTNSSSGSSGRTLSVAGLAPGDTRFYQIWYRDSASFCTAQTFNLTGAVALTWNP